MQRWKNPFCSPSSHQQNIYFHGNTIFYSIQTFIIRTFMLDFNKLHKNMLLVAITKKSFQTCNVFSQFSQINVIHTLQNQAPDFMNTSKREQLFDREKLMMSCPESSAGSPRPRVHRSMTECQRQQALCLGKALVNQVPGQRGIRCAGQSE